MGMKAEAVGPACLPEMESFVGLRLKSVRRMEDGLAFCFEQEAEATSGPTAIIQLTVVGDNAEMRLGKGTWKDKETVIG